jgi:hypothetical protein
MDDETRALIFDDGRPALKDDEVDTGQVKGVRSRKTGWASTHDYCFEWSAHFEALGVAA